MWFASRLTLRCAVVVLAGTLSVSALSAPPAGAEAGTRAAVERLYRAAFDRPADSDGLDYWLGVHADGVSLNEIAEFFTISDEFSVRYGSVENREFVTLVYDNVLDRAPDPAGLEYWVGVLEQGYSRGTLLNGFAQSAEFIRSSADPIPRLLLIGDSIFHGISALGLPIGGADLAFMTEEGRQASTLPALLDLARSNGSLQRADAVVIHLGTNGWADTYRAMFQAELDQLDGTPVLLVNTEVDRPWEQVANTNLEGLAAENEGVFLVDWNDAVAAREGLMRDDGVHPNRDGLAVLAGLIAERVRTL